MVRKSIPILLLILGTLLQASPDPLRSLVLGREGLVPAPIPVRLASILPIAQTDLNLDGMPESLMLAGGHLSIISKGSPVWQSPHAWEIIQASITDLDRDRKPEVTILLWRPFSPWPVDEWLPNGGRISEFHNAQGLSCHIILIGWRRGEFQELWAGSSMADPITSFATADLDGDKNQELVALEGRYSGNKQSPETSGGSKFTSILKVWEWNGFGFSVVSSIQDTFTQINLVKDISGNIYILVP
jgi:hypothetical protein